MSYQLTEQEKKLVAFCDEKKFDNEQTVALALLCQKDEHIKKLLNLCKDKTDFYECLELAVKISDEE